MMFMVIVTGYCWNSDLIDRDLALKRARTQQITHEIVIGK
jgi:hypothetical protein